jgi:hypothetical protein
VPALKEVPMGLIIDVSLTLFSILLYTKEVFVAGRKSNQDGAFELIGSPKKGEGP